jgi:hypothetical protein
MGATPNDMVKVAVSKIEAAKRQLDSAIELWFQEKDEIAVHTLLAAAYGVIYDLNKKHGTLHEALYDTAVVKEEYRREWVWTLKTPSNFFKHADKDSDPDGQVDFYPLLNVVYMLFAVTGLASLKQQPSVMARLFSLWMFIHEPRFLSPFGLDYFSQHIPADNVAELRPLSKKKFFEVLTKVAADYASGTLRV